MKKIILILLIAFSTNTAYSQGTPSQRSKILGKIDNALKQNDEGSAVYLANKYSDDEEVMTALLKIDGTLLKYASTRLRRNKNLILMAVSQNGLALEYVSKSLQDDKEIILEAATENIEALQFVSTNITKNRDFLLQILNNSKQIKQ